MIRQRPKVFWIYTKEDGKTSFVDGLVAKADTTIDGQEHLLSNFQDFDRWIYRNVSLTRKEFKSREDVQAILYDPNSTLLPIGVNALDNSLVTYDLASGPLYSFYTYSIGSETSKLKKSIELIQIGELVLSTMRSLRNCIMSNTIGVTTVPI